MSRAIEAFDGVYLSADPRLLLELLGRDKPMDGLRIFVGHSGWSPGQLENEIENGDWTPEHAESATIFEAKPERPWPSPDEPRRGRTHADAPIICTRSRGWFMLNDERGACSGSTPRREKS